MKIIVSTLFAIFILFFVASTQAQNGLKEIAFPFSFTARDLRTKADLKVDVNGNIWMAFGRRYSAPNSFEASSVGLAKYNGNIWRTYDITNSPLPTNYLTSLEVQGTALWIGTKNGLVKLIDSTFTIYNKINSGIVDDSVNDVSIINNNIWIATDHGVSHYDGKIWVNYTTANSAIKNERVNTITVDASGSVWIGTNTGLSHFKNGIWTNFDKSNSGLKSNTIHLVYYDKKGELWIGADTAITPEGMNYSALYKLDNATNKIIPAQDLLGGCSIEGLPKAVYSMTSDASGNTYVGGYNFIKDYRTQLTFVLGFKNLQRKKYSLPNSVSLYYDLGAFIDETPDGKLILVGAGLSSLYQFDISKYIEPKSDTSNTYAFLDINKVSTPILNRGDLFWDLNTNRYEVPKGTCKKPIFAAALWLGGVVNGKLKIAAQTYRQSGNDFYPGPLSIDGLASISPQMSNKYERLWKVNQSTIESFKLNFFNGNITKGTYKIPEEILSWPAHGDSAYSQNLAPFVDTDHNLKYEPLKGDYPLIKGDQMVYWIMNDNTYQHTETEGEAMGVEIHGSAYAYSCYKIGDNDLNTALNYTTFYHYDIYNRTTNKIDSFRIGFWMDPLIDLINYRFLGSNPKEDYAFSYNGDNFENGNRGYGASPPVVALAMLKGPLLADSNNAHVSSFMYYKNDFSTMGNPSRPEHYWSYLNHKWKDGSPLTYSGNGRAGNDTCSFAFPGTNDPNGRPEWVDTNTSFENTYILSTNSGSMISGELKTIDYAVVYSRLDDSTGWPKPHLSKLESDVKKVKAWFNAQSFPNCQPLSNGLIDENKAQKYGSILVYPNPAFDYINIHIKGIDTGQVEIYDLTGRLLLTAKNFNDPIPIQSFSTGMYILKISDKGMSYSTRFIKN